MPNIITQKHWVMAVDKPDDIDFKKYIGKFVQVLDENKKECVIEIERIVGNITHPNKFEIVSKQKHYLISMLDFFAQMNGEKISKEEIEAWDDTMFHIEKKSEVENRRAAWRRRNLIDMQLKKQKLKN